MNNIKYITLLLFIYFANYTFGQKETMVWYFGNHAGLTFECGMPKALTNSPMFSFEGCSNICDSNGNLLFFTDGGNDPYNSLPIGAIWNKSLNIMPNGYLGDTQGCSNSLQGACIIPNPKNNDQYYLFTTDCGEDSFSKGLRYATIDMNLDDGKGDVISKGNVLSQCRGESVHGIIHDNMRDYWIVISDRDSFIVFLIDSNGINMPPNKYSNNLSLFATGSNTEIKSSPDRTKIYFGGRIYDFSAGTGMISNPINLNPVINILYNPAYCSFSPNSKLLYLGGIGINPAILQFDLTAVDIPASKKVISTAANAIVCLSLAPDGKIYCSNDLGGALSVIHTPNSVGLACNFEMYAVSLQGRNTSAGLPNFPQHYFVNKLSPHTDTVSFFAKNLCIKDTSIFEERSGVFDMWKWDFGDSLSLNNIDTTNGDSVSHTYEKSGSYWVSLIASSSQNICAKDTFTQLITIRDIPTVDIKADGVDDSIIIVKNARVIITATTLNSDSVYFLTSNNTILSNVLLQEIYPEKSGMYYIYGINACDVAVDSVYILVFDSALIKTPTVFTPNNDGVNEVFIPFYEFITELEYLKIYNRWGTIVFQTDDLTKGWDGTYDGTPQQTGMYLFELKGKGLDQSVLSERGNVFLIR